jgi:hypothetical protein
MGDEHDPVGVRVAGERARRDRVGVLPEVLLPRLALARIPDRRQAHAVCGVDRVERLQRVAVDDRDIERADPRRIAVERASYRRRSNSASGCGAMWTAMPSPS